jgi:hypothetical protein
LLLEEILHHVLNSFHGGQGGDRLRELLEDDAAFDLRILGFEVDALMASTTSYAMDDPLISILKTNTGWLLGFLG